MIYEKYIGNDISVNIENIDGGEPYTKIGAKAFLSLKNIYEVELPDSIVEIGDWAFAHMKGLKRIKVPARKLSIGKDAFLDCDNLQEVAVYPDNSGNKGLPYLLASCITIFRSYELLDFEMAAGRNEEWCRLYDTELVKYLEQADDRGFEPVIVGWFNDEGEEEQLNRYLEKVRRNKIGLCFLRLKYDLHLENETKEILLSYLKRQIKQMDKGDSLLWSITRDVMSTDVDYAKIVVTNELLSETLISELITYLNSNNKSAEIVSYLIVALERKNKDKKQFDRLAL